MRFLIIFFLLLLLTASDTWKLCGIDGQKDQEIALFCKEDILSGYMIPSNFVSCDSLFDYSVLHITPKDTAYRALSYHILHLPYVNEVDN